MPLVPAPSSCMLALPARTAPQARSCATHAASASHRRAAASHRVPPVVGYGAQSISSFTATSTPSSADSGAPAPPASDHQFLQADIQPGGGGGGAMNESGRCRWRELGHSKPYLRLSVSMSDTNSGNHLSCLFIPLSCPTNSVFILLQFCLFF